MGSPAAFQTSDEAFRHLRHVGGQEDSAIDLGEAALALGLIFLPGLSPDRYRQHLSRLAGDLEAEFQTRLREGKEDALALRLQALRQVIHGAHGYRGDEESYDDIQNANFIRVIERRRGLPVALGLFYIILARGMGWACDGLSFPGHFLVRMEKDGARAIIDPFREGREMDAAALRHLLKSIVGKEAELSHNFYDPVPNREILLRLENNLKKRLIDQEDYAQAVAVAEAVEAFAPQEYRIYLDKGVLYAKLGQRQPAIAALETYIEKTPSAQEKRQARLLLEQIKAAPD